MEVRLVSGLIIVSYCRETKLESAHRSHNTLRRSHNDNKNSVVLVQNELWRVGVWFFTSLIIPYDSLIIMEAKILHTWPKSSLESTFLLPLRRPHCHSTGDTLSFEDPASS